MFKHCFRLAAFAAFVLVLPALSRAQTAPHPQWVGAWATSPMVADGGFNVRPFSGVTLREIVHISAGGAQIRVRFTNAYGTDPLTISDAHVALSAGSAAIQPGIDHAITFGGATSVNIPPGAELFSDPVALTVAPLSDLAISFYLPSQVMRAETFHSFAAQDNFIAEGDMSAAPDLPGATKVFSWYFLDGVDVQAVVGSRAIVTLGDSITDGALSTHNANRRWPDVLAARLHDDPNLKDVSVLNEGIGGNRVLNEGWGPSALSRLDRDVLSQSGVRYVIVLESINDIGRLAHLQTPWDDITASRLSAARATTPTRASRFAKRSTIGFAIAAHSTASPTSTRPPRIPRIQPISIRLTTQATTCTRATMAIRRWPAASTSPSSLGKRSALQVKETA